MAYVFGLSTRRARTGFSLFAAATVTVFATTYAVAQGVGTEFVKCRQAAWATYGSCSRANTGWGQVGCEIAIELDLLGCDVELVRDLNPLGDG